MRSQAEGKHEALPWFSSSRALMKSYVAVVAVLAIAGCTTPLGPDHPSFNTFVAAPRAGTDVTLVPILMGSSTAPRCAAAGEATCLATIEMLHTSYLLKHPQGNVLVDAGLSSLGREDVARFPFVRRLMMNYGDRGAGSLRAGLASAGNPDIKYVILTHVHWDHTSGLRDLEKPRVLMSPEDIAFSRQPGLEEGTVMANHLEGAEITPVNWDGPAVENFTASHDVFGDGSVVLVRMPGHTPGSLGVLVSRVKGRRLLFVGDTAWSLDAVAIPSHKLKLMSFVDHDAAGLSEALWRLHHLSKRDPDMLIVPTHDGRAFKAASALEGK